MTASAAQPSLAPRADRTSNAAPPPPSSAQQSGGERAGRDLSKRGHHCSACTQLGHNRKRCPQVYGPIAPPRATSSRSERAALLAATAGLSMPEAGERFGISHQAVRQAWVRIYGDAPTPTIETWQRRRAELAAAVADGASLETLQARTGLSASGVRALAKRAGVSVRSGRVRTPAPWDAAIAAVRGGASIGEASADHRVSYGRLLERVRAAGIRSTANGRRTYGIAPRAAELVRDERISIAAAARRYRISPAAVSAALKRLTRRSA
jgi:hypothetical protein